jgi:sterol desaturase/sphingolipid hydroxylase (fatty acid hydroxylase superfamily)
MVQTGREWRETLPERPGSRHGLSIVLASCVAVAIVGAVAVAARVGHLVPVALVRVPVKKAVALGALLAVFAPLEWAFALRRQRFLRRCWRADLVYFVLNGYFATAGALAGIVLLGFALRGLLPDGAHDAIVRQPGALQFVEALLLSEVCEYWAHRTMHTVPGLWRFHKVHHSVEEMDWLASARLHPVDRALTNGAAVLPIFVLGFTGTSIAVFALFCALLAMAEHANVRFTFGPLRFLVTTPQFHHWHHAEHVHDRNFATKLPFVDWAFRTMHVPARQWPRSYGMGERAPESYLAQLAWPFREIARSPRSGNVSGMESDLA